MKQIVEHLQLLHGLNRKETFDLLFNLGYINSDFKHLLAVTHDTPSRAKLLRNKHKITIGDSSLSLKEATSRILGDKNVTISSDIFYIIYKITDGLTANMRENLRNSLQYKIEPFEVIIEPKELKECLVCSWTSTKDICTSCTNRLKDFTEYRRESFIVPINYLNFNIKDLINTKSTFSIHYKDWVISKQSTDMEYQLVGTLYDSVREEYPLPFIEYQLSIV